MILPVYKNSVQISQIKVPDELTITKELMGAREIAANLELPGVLLSPIGSTIVFRGETFTINTAPSPTKISNYKYQYEVVFESVLYKLYDKKLKHLGNKTFQYYGNLTTLAQLIVDNMNTIDAGWTVGPCDDIPEKNITFTGQSCRSGLDVVAEVFEMEWDVTATKQIIFTKQVGNTTSLVFEYGRGKGLYSLGYKYNNDKNIVTRATGYGSTRNLPEGYRNGATQLMFDGEYLDKNIYNNNNPVDGLLYGIKEGDYENLDIYPQINGVVSAVSAFDANSNTFTITDSGLTFNLNDYFSTTDPKLSFKTGELQGQEFKILKYDNGTKTITLEVFKDGNDNKLPNITFQPAIGDTYDLFDMHLPDEAVQDAEDRLLAATQAWLDENCVPRVIYNLDIDPIYVRDNGIELEYGDKIRIVDTALGIDELIRITKITLPVVFPDYLPPDMKISCEIANFIPYTLTERVISDTIDNQKEIKVVDRTNAERARLNSLNMKTLAGRLFDPDGNLAKGSESLYAAMATFGFDSQNFSLVDITIAANAGGDPNSLVIGGGHLVHYFYEVEGLGFDWVMSPNSWSGLDPAKFYYVYAKCSKTSLVGTWEISETPVFANDIPGYWAFNLGQLFEVNSEGYRNFEFTKGMTYIVGDQITTGTIKSIDGVNYINLTEAKANLGVTDQGLDWNVSAPATLTIRGAVASKVIKVGSGGLENAGISGITDAGTSSIRFWAGETEANKATAPFRVQDDGKAIMKAGEISNFKIDGNGLTNDNGEAFISVKKVTGSTAIGASVGSGIDASSFWGLTSKAAGVFVNTVSESDDNVGVYIDVDNPGSGRALALNINRGSVLFSKNAPIIMEKSDGTLEQAIDYSTFRVILDTGGAVDLTFVNGSLTRITP